MSPSPYARRSLLAVTSLLLVAACDTGGDDSPGAAPSSSSVQGLQAALEGFYDQDLDWGSCDGYTTTATEAAVVAAAPTLECARLLVPLDYDKPAGDTMTIAVARQPARGEAIGSLITNPGGPGGAGVFTTAASALGLAESPFTERFDLVGFDPRGVGASEPAVDCYSDAEADLDAVPTTAQGTTVSFTEADTRALAERCAEGSGDNDVLAALGTRDVARDVDVLREVLGDDELTFLGQSYGTRLGAVYAEQFPDNVRAMLLDGAFDPGLGTLERRVDAYAGFQRAFEQMAVWCAQQDDCPLGPDPARATKVFQETVRPLLEDPVPAQGRELGFDAAVAGVISGLYSQDSWPRIVAGIDEVQQGRGDELLQLSRDFSGRDAEGVWTNFGEANYAINCMDEQRLTPEEGAQLRTMTYADAPFMDPGVDVTDGARDTCEHWPADPTLGIPYAQDVQGLPDTLVVSITGDPTTPHSGGIALAQTLGGALLTVEGEGHTVVMTGQNPCVDEIAAAYLIDLQVPEEGTTCTL